MTGNTTGYIQIWSDNWSENGRIYKVLSYFKPADSTGVHLELQDSEGIIEKKVIPIHNIEWIPDGDW